MKKTNNIKKALLILMLVVTGITSKAQVLTVSRTINAENRVAILPMVYIGNGSEVRMDEMRYRLQNIAYLYLKADATELRFQDPSETNALLMKNGINEYNFRQFTPAELAVMLHVEYVLMGTVSQESVGTTSRDNSRRVIYSDRRGRHEREIRGHIRMVEEFSTYIDLSIYNDRGDQVFSRSRHSILSTSGAYRNGLEYLLKRTPLYRK